LRTDGNLWYRLGAHSLAAGNLPLAKHALEVALARSPRHWLSLHKLAVVVFALGDELGCRALAGQLRQLDPLSKDARTLDLIGMTQDLPAFALVFF
jgi:Flp pilus assembly protein TadD